MPAITRVVLKSGHEHEIGIRAPMGTKEAPFTDRQKRAKFHDCCRWAGKEDRADALFDLARSIPAMPEFSEFSHALAHEYSKV
jgi:hypothetical protein